MDYKLVGAPCGEHGPYIFYKALKYCKNGKSNILALSEFFFVKLWPDSDLISIGELQLLWEDKNSEQTLASLRLYILPENTPDGRLDVHGEDEVLAITEKVVIRVEDLLTWITHATDWNWGLGAVWERDCPQNEGATFNKSLALDMEDVKREKQALGPNHWETQTGVVVLSYPRYCRYRGIIKRLEGVEDRWLKTTLVVALGGFTAPWKDTRVLFCKDTFDYPELEGHELLCNHLAPKLKGRPRKRKKTNVSPDDSESESESSHSNGSATSKMEFVKPSSPTKYGITRPKPSLRCIPLEVLKKRGPSSEERNFLVSLHSFMRERKTPIGKMPIVGFKEVNLYKLYRKVRDLGGYDVVCARKLWNSIYEMMGGDARRHGNTAGTLSRRHYEKLLLPYEKHLNGLKLPVKHRPTLSLPPVPRLEGRIVINKNPPMRNIRLKPEVRVNGEKENIPQRRITASSASSVLTIIPELAELIPKDTSIITGPRALSPFLKQQKLEILKEGGLEVTPVRPTVNSVSRSSASAKLSSVTTPPVADLSRKYEDDETDDDKVSITVTPDMTHLLCPPGVPGPSRRASLPIVKEVKRAVPDALDLRLSKPLLNIGSNLEITLVPPKPQPLPRGVAVTKKKPSLQTPIQVTSPAVRVPSLPYQPYPGSYKPFVPVVDPVYLSVISSTGPISASAAAAAAAATGGRGLPATGGASASTVGGTTVAATDLYKEFLRNKRSVFIRDGTTSITLVGPSPNPK